jgi:PLP dependent protein
MSISDNYSKLRAKLPEEVELVAISKNKSIEEIMELYNCGQRVFGENKVQELATKHESLPDDIRWHMVGHLQSNKVKYISPFIEMIHSVDSLKLLKVINKEAKKYNRIIPCLLQLHIAEEETKFGLSFEETCILLEHHDYKAMENISIHGLMGMATFTENSAQIHKEFKQLKDSFDKIKTSYFPDNQSFCELSMGMSDDFLIGVEEGSTMVRVGTALFGER